MPLQVHDGPVIEAGESLSDVVEVNGSLARLTMPAAWTSAQLTFQVSSDGETFNDLCDFHGDEIAINVREGAAVIVPEDIARGFTSLKLRSGTSDYPINQAERREFSVAVLTGGNVSLSL